jgi:selenocysteine lyase/cysteine desulfurase
MISYRDGRLRASPHFYNDASDVDALLDSLASA